MNSESIITVRMGDVVIAKLAHEKRSASGEKPIQKGIGRRHESGILRILRIRVG